jgi:hypothetical protein
VPVLVLVLVLALVSVLVLGPARKAVGGWKCWVSRRVVCL